MLLAVGTLCLMAGCSSKVSSSKGIVSDATMNTVTIVTDKNDTLSFSTMDANKEEVNGLLLNDTLEVFYTIRKLLYVGNIRKRKRVNLFLNVGRM